MKNGDGIRQQNGVNKQPDGEGDRRELSNGKLNSQQQGDDQYSYFRQPRQPEPGLRRRLHYRSHICTLQGFKLSRIQGFASLDSLCETLKPSLVETCFC